MYCKHYCQCPLVILTTSSTFTKLTHFIPFYRFTQHLLPPQLIYFWYIRSFSWKKPKKSGFFMNNIILLHFVCICLSLILADSKFGEHTKPSSIITGNPFKGLASNKGMMDRGTLKFNWKAKYNKIFCK